jgi:hypothetical protein
MGDRISFPGATIGECLGMKTKACTSILAGTYPSQS